MKKELPFKLILKKKSRRAPIPGDLFRFDFDDGRSFFGKVLRDNIDPRTVKRKVGEKDRASLWIVVVYSDEARQQLLAGPEIINRLGWLHGYFETTGNEDVTESEKQCLRYWRDSWKYYEVDWETEKSEVIEKPDTSWIGFLASGNYLTLESDVLRALGELPEE
jgi:hypothetical protein